MLSGIERVVGWLVGAAALLGGVALVFLVGVICVDVVGRAFGAPLYGSRDLVQMGAVLVIFGGMAYADRKEGHIQVDILEKAFSPEVNRWLRVLGYLVGAVAFALIAWQLWVSAGLSQMMRSTYNLITLPRAWFQYAIAALSVVAVAQMLLRAFALASGRARP
jgi:TRAP-type C4-dicarboxylate transport system permease small subunit